LETTEEGTKKKRYEEAEKGLYEEAETNETESN
jgi:hypothetical protein